MKTKFGNIWLWLFLAGAFALSRLLFLPSTLQDLDGVNFAKGLEDYDLMRSQPHFPGYPVYLAVAKAMNVLGADAVTSLVLPGMLFLAVASVFYFVTLRQSWGGKAAWIGWGLFTFTPLLWLESVKPASDALACALFVIALAGLLRPERGHRIAGLFVLGLMLGVRLSYAPLWLTGLAWFWAKEKNRREGLKQGAAAAALGVAVWGVSFLIEIGPMRLWEIGTTFTGGHLTRWGGTVLVQSSLGERFLQLMWNLLPNGLGSWWTDKAPALILPSLVLAGSLVAALVLKRQEEGEVSPKRVLAFGLPYLVAVFFFQNLAKPRHVLPLIPLLIFAVSVSISVGLEAVSRRGQAAVFLALFAPLLPSAASLLWIYRTEPAPAVQLVRYVDEHYTGEGLQVLSGEEVRLFDYYAPHIPVMWKDRHGDLAQEVFKLGFRPSSILVTSQAVNDVTEDLVPVRSFVRNRYVHNHYHSLTLYALRTPL